MHGLSRGLLDGGIRSSFRESDLASGNLYTATSAKVVSRGGAVVQ